MATIVLPADRVREAAEKTIAEIKDKRAAYDELLELAKLGVNNTAAAQALCKEIVENGFPFVGAMG